MKIFKPAFWSKKNSIISFFLLPLSIFFQYFLILTSVLKKKKKFSIPVICVGNIYLGGTGKTPLCIELAKFLSESNRKTAIIKKFYKDHEDEFRLIESKNIKLFTGLSRDKIIKSAILDKFDCVILDDGFQDSTIFKNLNIICFNEKQLAGNEMTLPSGPLRAPLSSLKKSQIVVINGQVNNSFERRIKDISENINIYYSEYLPINLDQFTNQNLLAFAGIGNPNNFFDLLTENNLKVVKKISFPDHYDYSLKELDDIVKYSDDNQLKIITTEKDYFRIKHRNILKIQYLDIKLEIKNKENFVKDVLKCLS